MKKIVALSLCLLFFSQVFSQGVMKTRKWRKSEKDSLLVAQNLFTEENYLLALPIFDKIEQNHPKELYLKYVLGICGLYRSDVHQRSLEYLLAVYEKNKKAAGIRYDLARAYHYNYKFDEALAMIEEYLKDKKLTEKDRKDAEQLKEYCNNAKILMATPVDAKIENIGDILNTVGSEYVPVISSDESVMIYTYTGDQSVGGLQNGYNVADTFGIYYEDVFISHKEGGTWATPASIGATINTNAHDAAIAISNDGQKLFVFKDNSYDGGDIYISTVDTSGYWSAPEKVKGEVNTAAWEGSASLSSDEKTLFFASERPGGFGGRDLYKATLLPDGNWGNIQNLGDKVNTVRDDDAPFIHPDGKTLIFSSQALNSMGSYDIFLTEYSASDSSWSTPKNLGYPINTPDDDRYFVLSTDGNRGYYASGKEGGFGLHDIYVVDMPDNFNKPNVIMVKGTTTVDDKPVIVSVSVDMTDNNKNYRSTNTTKEGSYLVNLTSGHNYKITYKLNGFPDEVRTVDAMSVSGYVEKIFDIKFSTKKDSTLIKDSISLALAKTDSIKNAGAGTTPSIGNASKEGLEFKVQIAAYNLPKNYKYDYLNGLGAVEKLLLDDGITRFTIGGSFKTLNEAIAHKDKVRAAGQKDAFVTAIYNGKRVYLEDLEKQGLIPATPK